MLSYFQEEWKILFFVTVSGLIYNLGLLAGPWFEGKMTGKLLISSAAQEPSTRC